jgi:hypothetical protein
MLARTCAYDTTLCIWLRELDIGDMEVYPPKLLAVHADALGVLNGDQLTTHNIQLFKVVAVGHYSLPSVARRR